MNRLTQYLAAVAGTLCILSGCAAKQPLTIDPGTVPPGSKVTRAGKELPLTGTALEVGQHLPAVFLVAAQNLADVSLADYRGEILLLSIVPSIDTQVCEAQTHYLGEQGDALPLSIRRITISRDTPFAQMRFAKEAELEDIVYLSDYKEGSFGKATGLLMEGPRLLARAIIIADRDGIVRYLQVVPEITNLPDMERAFAKARELAQ